MMTKATDKELERINMLYNDIFDDYNIGYDYSQEGAKITDFKYDEDGNVEIELFIQWLNDQYALRSTEKVIEKKLLKGELDYLLGRE